MVHVGGNPLLTNDFERVIYGNESVDLQPDALQKVKINYEFLQRYSKDKIIYGINTGLGPMAQYKISESEQLELQFNLIRSHSSGSGHHFTEELARATMLARLNSLMQATSGIHPEVVELLKQLLNSKVSACIFERGGVGASGEIGRAHV